MKKGLVLEGGAMRGLFSEGIYDVFLENSITFDGMIGVSAGAAFGCNFKSGQIGRALRYNKSYCRDKRYCSLRSWLKTGDLFNADFCYRVLPDELDIFDREAFENNPMDFYMAVTDLASGHAVYRLSNKADQECFDFMRGSASMPLVSSIVEIGNGKYLDGAIADSVPLKYFESLGYEKNVVILTRERGYIKKTSSLQWLLNIIYRKYPAFVEAMKKRHIMYNEQIAYIEEQAEKGKVFLLRPEYKLPVKRICRDGIVLQEVYDIGRDLALKNIEQIKKFLAE